MSKDGQGDAAVARVVAASIEYRTVRGIGLRLGGLIDQIVLMERLVPEIAIVGSARRRGQAVRRHDALTRAAELAAPSVGLSLPISVAARPSGSTPLRFLGARVRSGEHDQDRPRSSRQGAWARPQPFAAVLARATVRRQRHLPRPRRSITGALLRSPPDSPLTRRDGRRPRSSRAWAHRRIRRSRSGGRSRGSL